MTFAYVREHWLYTGIWRWVGAAACKRGERGARAGCGVCSLHPSKPTEGVTGAPHTCCTHLQGTHPLSARVPLYTYVHSRTPTCVCTPPPPTRAVGCPSWARASGNPQPTTRSPTTSGSRSRQASERRGSALTAACLLKWGAQGPRSPLMSCAQLRVKTPPRHRRDTALVSGKRNARVPQQPMPCAHAAHRALRHALSPVQLSHRDLAANRRLPRRRRALATRRKHLLHRHVRQRGGLC